MKAFNGENFACTLIFKPSALITFEIDPALLALKYPAGYVSPDELTARLFYLVVCISIQDQV